MGRGLISLVLCFLVVTSSASAQVPSLDCMQVVTGQMLELQEIAFRAEEAATIETDRNIACGLWKKALQAQQQFVAYANQCEKVSAIQGEQRARLYEYNVGAICSGQ
jgi:hypothetical protein